MNYTEKEQKGIDKVKRMNAFFDRMFLPAIGVIIILSLISFIVGNIMDRTRPTSDISSISSDDSNASEIFVARDALLKDYDKYSDKFLNYGYSVAEGYKQDLALCKVVDDELMIYQFADSAIGNFTILKYTPSNEAEAKYSLLSLTVYSEKLINVMLRAGDDEYKVTFNSANFSSYSPEDKSEYKSMMSIISKQDLDAMYELFEADIQNIAELCF